MNATTRPVALVTGGRQGIGLAIVYSLAAAGFDVAFTARSTTDSCGEIIAECESLGARAQYFPSELGAIEAHQALIEQVTAWGGGLDCLVNNAGVGTLVRGDLLEMPPESFDHVMGINARGTLFLTQAVARWMLANPSPHYRSLLLVSSVSAEMASPERGDYCMSKAALGMMTKLFALRLAADNIGVFELRPGIIKTGMTAGVSDKYDRRIAEGLVPALRWGEPGDIGRAVLPFARGDMAFASGSTLQLDGGLSINRF
ncbi:3-ketoacyl-ACP reductase [Marinobacterium aestuarii]|uniref:3-ketoacyl-ACP reductase n=1 Tax=Marinobacterium aestuarii TaxID=1821621 RepID=A0A1A9EXY7_9GAMM|nr:3-ketoacyl-ACP reductase [Marinobacterium aestuarii]ANG62747.1 3-ketoacyl-ACP reductase [Marinobacterium aestuarii]